MTEKPESGLFRRKSLEAAKAANLPNDYLRVPPACLRLAAAAAAALLLGALLWGMLGRGASGPGEPAADTPAAAAVGADRR